MLGQNASHQSRSPSAVAASGARRSWEVDLGEVVLGSCVIAADGTIYAATEHALHAVSPEGVAKWAFPLKFPDEEPPSPALGADGTIYVRNDDAFAAIRPNGTLKWEAPLPHGVLSSPTVASDGTIYVADTSGPLFALSKTGSVLETFGLDDGRYSTPIIVDEQTITFLQVDTFVTEVFEYRRDGVLGFRVKNVGAVYGYQAYPVSGADGSTYVAADGHVVALSPSGERLWDYQNESGNVGPAIGSDGTLFLPARPLTALHPDGSVAWKYEAGGKAYARSVAVASDGIIYAAGDRLYTLYPNGELIKIEDVGSEIRSAIAFDSDGTAIFGAADGRIYAR